MCWVHWYEFTLRFAIKGRVSLINNFCKHHITLFSLYEFSLGVSHMKVIISSIFSHRSFWWMILGHKMHCTLLSVSFPFMVSHIKFFMRQYPHKSICYIIYFPHQGFWKMIFEAYWPNGQIVFRLRLCVYLKGSNNIGDYISWCFSLFFPLGFKEFCLVYRYYFGFSHKVF